MVNVMKANDCKAIRQQIGELEGDCETNATIQGHVQTCPMCRRFLEDEKSLRRLVASLVPVEAPADFDFRLRARLANERVSRPGLQRIGKISFAGPAITVAAVAVLVVGIALFQQLKPVSEPPAIALKNQTQRAEQPSAQSRHESQAQEIQVKSGEPEEDRALKSSGLNAQARRATMVSERPRRLVAVDSAVTKASVVRQDDLLIGSESQLTIPVQTLKVSVDDGSGVSRTISLPTVSFGSERVLTNARSGLAQPTKVSW